MKTRHYIHHLSEEIIFVWRKMISLIKECTEKMNLFIFRWSWQKLGQEYQANCTNLEIETNPGGVVYVGGFMVPGNLKELPQECLESGIEFILYVKQWTMQLSRKLKTCCWWSFVPFSISRYANAPCWRMRFRSQAQNLYRTYIWLLNTVSVSSVKFCSVLKGRCEDFLFFFAR